MEILLNCLWLVLSLSLVTVWAVSARRAQHATRRHCGRPALLPCWRMQLTAIAVLVLLLFPVISLTDDLAWCSATPETEQALRLSSLNTETHHYTVTLPSTLAWMQTVTPLVRAVALGSVKREVQLLLPHEVASLPVHSRPPPIDTLA